MNINEITLEQIEARKLEIKSLVENKDENSDFEALSAEIDALDERAAFLKEEQRKTDIQNVIEGVNTEEHIIELPKEERQMKTIKEIRSSQDYVEAFAKYMKTEDDKECRALLTDFVIGGQVPVPTFVEDEIKTAWEKSELLNLVKKTYVKGILKVGFELSASGAVVHTEGAKAPDEETLTIGIVTLTPASIKKWITVSDEVYDMKGEAFLRYIYDEVIYRIAKKAEQELLALINNAPATAGATAVGVPVLEADLIALDTIAKAIAKLSDTAANAVIVMNKSTWAAFKAVQYAGTYAVDPFEGLTVVFNNDVTAFDEAEAGETYAIVGDFGVGAQANFPNGDEIAIKFDDISLAEKDLIKIVGRQYVGLGLVADKAFVKIAKEAES